MEIESITCTQPNSLLSEVLRTFQTFDEMLTMYFPVMKRRSYVINRTRKINPQILFSKNAVGIGD